MIHKLIVLLVVFVGSISSCTIENRLHLSGNNLNWKSQNPFRESKLSNSNQNLTSSSENHFTASISPGENDFKYLNSSDTIYLISGKKIIASVLKVAIEDVILENKLKRYNRKNRISKIEISHIITAKGEKIIFPFYDDSYNGVKDTANAEKNLDLLVFNSGRKILVFNLETDSLKVFYQTPKQDDIVWSRDISKVAYVIDKNGIVKNFSNTTNKDVNFDHQIKKYKTRKKTLTPLIIALGGIVLIGLVYIGLRSITLESGSSFF